MRPLPRSLLRWSASSLLLGTLGCACPKVALPASDATPPVITWKVTNEATNAVQSFTGNGSFTASWGEHFSVKMTASDTGGVNEASLFGSESWTCISGSIASQTGPGLEVADVEKHDVWPSGQVCSEMKKFRDVNLSFDCKSGYQFGSGHIALTGTGKNFYGGETTASLSIIVTP